MLRKNLAAITILACIASSASATRYVPHPQVFKDDVTVQGDCTIEGDLTVDGVETVTTDPHVNSLHVDTTSALDGAVTAGSTLGVTGNFAVATNKFNVTAASGNVAAAGTFAATGAATFGSTVGITGNVAVNTDKFAVTASNGNTSIAGTLGVTGASTLAAVACTTLSPSGDVAVATNKFTVAAASGNVASAGTGAFTGALSSSAGVTGTMFTSTPQTLTVADSGDGSAATATLTPTATLVKGTCQDADGCTITMGEGSAAEGQIVIISNVGTNALAFSDSSGVSELTGTVTLGAKDTLTLVYSGSAWQEVATSNN